MDKREINTATYIHHTATFTGFFAGLYFLLFKKQKFPVKLLLFLHMCTQGFAILKIVCDFLDGNNRFAKSYEKVHNMCKNTAMEKVKYVLLALASFFKLGVPVILGKSRS